MATIDWRGASVERLVKAYIGAQMAEAVEAAKGRLQARTPVRTGYLRASEYGALVDESGAIVAGDRADGNGVPVPSRGAASNVFAAVLGANAPYAPYVLEYGSRGRAGPMLVSQTHQELAEDIKARLDAIGRR